MPSYVLKRGSFYMTDSCQKCSRGTSLGRSKPIFSCVSKAHCSYMSMYVNYWLLSSQQQYVGMCVLCFGARAPVKVGKRKASGSMCEKSLNSRPSCARVHTLTPSHLPLYMCPPGGHPILSACVCLWSRHSIPLDPLYMCVLRGTLFLSFTIETRHALIPSSFPLSHSRAVCRSEQVSSPRDVWAVQHPFHLHSLSWSHVDAPKKHCQEKKINC